MKDFVLTKEVWKESDVMPFLNFLKSLSCGEEASKREKQIVCTFLDCIAVKSEDVNKIVKEICRGNYISFLDLWIVKYFTNITILGGVISKIKEFNTLKKYLNKYASICDCWASTDCLKFNVRKNEENFFALAKEYLKSEKPFVRRIGIRILFKFINKTHLKEIFSLLKSLKNEKEYYVNMAVSWFLCECFIKERNLTLEFLKENCLNEFVLRKTISKCHDSFRVTNEDKKLLTNLKESLC